MTLDEIIAGIRTLTDEDYYRLSDEMYVIGREREARAQVEAAQAELVAELQEQHPELAPKYATHLDEAESLDQLLAKLPPFVQPTSKANAYPAASLVKHKGKPYRARRMTDKEPGTPFSGWEDVTADFLRPEPIADGNTDGVGTDAPGLITEPDEPEVTPAPELQEWKAGGWYSKGESVRVGNVAYTSLKLHRATDATHPTKNTPEWLKLG